MAVKIVVLSDGTWERVGPAQVWTITDDAYDTLCEGMETGDLEDSKVLSVRNLDENG